MTRSDAYRAMATGSKIQHYSFTVEEFLHMSGGAILDENNYNFEDGWRMRSGGIWESGWKVLD